MPTAVQPIQKQNIFERPGVRAVRLSIQSGHAVPTHSSNVDVTAVTVRGAGTFTVEGKPTHLEPGVVVEMRPDTAHSVAADAGRDLELVVLHYRLSADSPVAVHCGA